MLSSDVREEQRTYVQVPSEFCWQLGCAAQFDVVRQTLAKQRLAVEFHKHFASDQHAAGSGYPQSWLMQIPGVAGVSWYHLHNGLISQVSFAGATPQPA